MAIQKKIYPVICLKGYNFGIMHLYFQLIISFYNHKIHSSIFFKVTSPPFMRNVPFLCITQCYIKLSIILNIPYQNWLRKSWMPNQVFYSLFSLYLLTHLHYITFQKDFWKFLIMPVNTFYPKQKLSKCILGKGGEERGRHGFPTSPMPTFIFCCLKWLLLMLVNWFLNIFLYTGLQFSSLHFKIFNHSTMSKQEGSAMEKWGELVRNENMDAAQSLGKRHSPLREQILHHLMGQRHYPRAATKARGMPPALRTPAWWAQWGYC